MGVYTTALEQVWHLSVNTSGKVVYADPSVEDKCFPERWDAHAALMGTNTPSAYLPPSLSLPHTHVDQPVLFCSFFFPSLSAVVWHQPCCPDELVIVTETQETAGPHLPHSGTTVCTGVSLTCLTTCVILHWHLHYCCTCTLLWSTIFISGFLFFGCLWYFNYLNYWYTVSKDEPYKNTSWAIKNVLILPENVWLMLQHPEHRITGDEVGWVDRWSEISTTAGWP